MNRAIMQQALDALNTCDWDYDSEEEPYKTFDEDLVNAAAAALKAALAEPDLSIEANRVAYDVAMHYANKTKEKLSEQVITPISPDQYERFCGKCGACLGKPWVGLTDEEILDLWIANHKDTGATDAFARAIEAKLKEKNT